VEAVRAIRARAADKNLEGMLSIAGSGSTFWLALPLAHSPVGAVEAVMDVESTMRAESQPTRTRPRVLIVEDNSLNAMVAKRILEKLDCAVEIAENGRIALDCVHRTRYDLILMDCQMPEVDGFEATQLIRSHESGLAYRTPIVALSANVLPQDRERCLDAGMDGHLCKPTSVQDLAQALQRWCGC
jgi:CheY-like chemotaxis protein